MFVENCSLLATCISNPTLHLNNIFWPLSSQTWSAFFGWIPPAAVLGTEERPVIPGRRVFPDRRIFSSCQGTPGLDIPVIRSRVPAFPGGCPSCQFPSLSFRGEDSERPVENYQNSTRAHGDIETGPLEEKPLRLLVRFPMRWFQDLGGGGGEGVEEYSSPFSNLTPSRIKSAKEAWLPLLDSFCYGRFDKNSRTPKVSQAGTGP